MKTMLLIILTILLPLSTAHGYVINGMLDDWGVAPHIQWVPTQSSVSWIEEDNWGSAHPDYPSGGEIYDAEALYCDVIGGMSYIALVTSFPSSGYQYCRPGDIAIDLDRDGVYEYGIQTTGPYAGALVADPIWSTATTYALASPAEILDGTLLDWVPLAYVNSGIIENNKPTYILETAFDMSLLGNPAQPFGLHWTMSCGNDLLDLTVTPIPEPGTILLLGSGLATLWAFTRGQRKRRRNL